MDAKKSAIKIVETLREAGHTAYFAGGWVRDLVMEHPSNDIDIATSAIPEQIISLFPKTIPVGAAFGVVVVVADGFQFEVSTFRKDLDYQDGRHPEGVTFSTPEEDAKRRDFTINGLFYDPLEDQIYDFVGGVEDIKKGVIRAIGNPEERFREDRLRMIRAIRFSCRFGFKLDSETERAIQKYAKELFPAVSVERIWQEFVKMSESGHFNKAILEMHRLGLLQVIFPELVSLTDEEIREKVAPFKEFPEETPTIAFLLEILPDFDNRLKVSNQVLKLAEFLKEGKELLQRESVSDIEWAHFYAHPESKLCLRLVAAHQKERESYLKEHRERASRLQPHVERIQKGQPLVTGQMLKEYGFSEGRKLGNLLKRAEEITITQDLQTSHEVIELLKQEPEWDAKEN